MFNQPNPLQPKLNCYAMTKAQKKELQNQMFYVFAVTLVIVVIFFLVLASFGWQFDITTNTIAVIGLMVIAIMTILFYMKINKTETCGEQNEAIQNAQLIASAQQKASLGQPLTQAELNVLGRIT